MSTQTELYRLLAETSIRADSILSLHRKSFEGLPGRQDAILSELQQLSQQIEDQGIGADTQAEDRYLELLQEYRYLDQSYDLGLKLHGRNEGGSLEKAVSPSPDDERLIAYCRLLLKTYSGGALIKGAAEDLEYWANRLEQMTDNEAQELAERLRGVDATSV